MTNEEICKLTALLEAALEEIRQARRAMDEVEKLYRDRTETLTAAEAEDYQRALAEVEALNRYHTETLAQLDRLDRQVALLATIDGESFQALARRVRNAIAIARGLRKISREYRKILEQFGAPKPAEIDRQTTTVVENEARTPRSGDAHGR
jgi:GTP1/Obg family GTP-binding protein